MPFSVHSTLEKHMRKCVVVNQLGGRYNPIASDRKSKFFKIFSSLQKFSVSPLKANSTPLAEANSLLALSKAPVSLNNTPQLPPNIAQSNQMVLNWLQVKIELLIFVLILGIFEARVKSRRERGNIGNF
jgi:hypothetical protein